MLLNDTPSLRQAGAADWPAIEALLLANKLPTEGAQAHLPTYLLAISNGEVVGCAGAEVYGHVAGTIALLRSVAIAPGLHKQGIGRLLVERLLQEARSRDIAALYLLTVTAPEYFAQYGFKRIKIEEAPQALKASAEFQGACPACAALMTLVLREAPVADGPLPVAVLGAGPVGLAAVAQLIERGLPFVALEAGATVGANLVDYGHVQLFSPWQFDVDPAMARLLLPTGWTAPPAAELPKAGEVVERVLKPFAALPQVAGALKLGARVVAVSREGFDKVKSAGRDQAAFLIRYEQGGEVHELRARAVIDATGTWNQPNPVGANGLHAIGETEAGAQIFYGIPDVTGAQRARYEGRRTLVVGAGHSAANALLALAELARQSPGTRLAWAVRTPTLQRVFGGGDADALPARGALGTSLRRLHDGGALEFFAGLRITRIERVGGQLRLSGLDPKQQPVVVDGVDEIICATGQRPDLSLASELRVKLDPWLESTEALGPLIDPNLHSCGTVRPHGHRELAHPEPGFYTVGVKSYGRAPTFLMATGFEQARSVVAAIAGDLTAADRVELELPETGVCSVNLAVEGEASGCCGPAAVVAVAAPKSGCGPSSCAPKPAPERASRCCG
ncbi:arsenic resistance N-acetyltransferase ArsN2 [Pelomonas sp. Root1237]|uniref:arsenic resistance N-acetyltransferase ArsN2 n=1 Tax=Pelomonas sp. Root1237 TaxID=1736434 RepID=UPI0009E7003D|nr:arsenic resistance N-acetyltransferase ArsN2 [Pelomonas sp. Root1237]